MRKYIRLLYFTLVRSLFDFLLPLIHLYTREALPYLSFITETEAIPFTLENNKCRPISATTPKRDYTLYTREQKNVSLLLPGYWYHLLISSLLPWYRLLWWNVYLLCYTYDSDGGLLVFSESAELINNIFVCSSVYDNRVVLV